MIVATTLLCGESDAAATPPAVVPDSARVIGNGGNGPYWFSGFFILRDSEVLRTGARVLTRDTDYTIDYDNGRIRFTGPLAGADTVDIQYVRLAWALPTRLTLTPGSHTGSGNTMPDVAIIPVAVTTRSPSAPVILRPGLPASELRWQGFKSFTLSATEGGDPSWSQGLELSVDGELTEGLQLSATITDRFSDNLSSRNTSATGSRLGDLDRLFVEARSKKFFGRWGEMTLGAHSGHSRGRHASGLQARWSDSTHAVGGYLARARGQWARREIPLRAGDAGPYQLTEKSLTGGIVRPSVSVWLDGHLLTEGVDHDYTADAGTGTITFAPGIEITGRSVCTVEYEQAIDTYRRTLAGADWSWQGSEQRFGHQLSARWEGDDPSQPLFGTLSSADRDILASDPSGSVTTPGARPVGSQRGDYRLDLRADGDSVFVYAGPGNGDWQVRFEWVGSGAGDYHHVVNEVFEYLGSNLGAYNATTTLNAPTSYLAIQESLDFDIGSAGRVSGDWSGIAVDPNRLATDNTVVSSDHRVGWRLGNPSEAAGSAGIEWSWNRQGNLADATRRRGALLERLQRQWSLGSRIHDARYDEHSAMAATPIGAAHFQIEGGLFRGDGLEAWRGRGVSRIRLGKPVGARFEWSHREAQNPGNRQGVDQGTGYAADLEIVSSIATFAAGGSEDSYHTPSRLLKPTSAFTATRWISLSRWGVVARHRWERTVDTVQYRMRRTREFSLDVPVAVLGARAGSGLTLARGRESYSGSGETPFYRGRLHSEWQPIPNATISAEMQLSRGTSGIQREVYLPSRPGMGQYRYERGEYVADPHGDFRRVLTDDRETLQAAYDGMRRVSIRWNPHLWGWRFSVESRRESRGRYSPGQFRPGPWLAPWRDNQEALAPGAYWSAGDYHLMTVRPDAATDIHLQFTRDRRITAARDPDGIATEQSTRSRSEARARRRFHRWMYVEGGAAYEEYTRDGLDRTAVTGTAHTILLTLGATPRVGAAGQTGALGLSAETRRRVDAETRLGQHVTLWGLRPVARMNLGGFQLSALTDATWVYAAAAGTVSALLAEGRPEGFSVTESLEMRLQLPRRVTMRARLTGDQREAGPDRWRMELETIARF